MEWLILLLLVPAILAPIVLLGGFAGCDLVFPLTAPVFGTTFELDSEHDFNLPDSTTTMNQSLEGACFVVRIPSARLLRDGERVAITVRGSTAGDLKIDRVYISQAADSVDPAADPYDSLAADLTKVVEGEVLVPQGQPKTLGAFDYHLSRTEDLIIAFDISSTSGFGNVRFVDFPDVSMPVTYFKLATMPGTAVQQAAIADRLPPPEFSPSVSPDGLTFFLYLVEKIEVQEEA